MSASTPAAAGPARVSVLYIGGWGRSGSTLLDRVLGQVPGVVSLGEVRELWQRGWVENRPCGCGAPFADCPFWTEVGRRAFGGWASLDRDEVLRLRYSLDRPWATPMLLGRRSVGFMGRRAATYTSILDTLYRALGDVSGAKVIVDSSKLPSHALLLRRVPAIDLIDFEYGPGNRYWHTSHDLPEQCSAASLEQVGKVVTAWLALPRSKRR